MALGLDAERMIPSRERDGLFYASLVLLAGTGLAALWSASTGYALSLGKPASWFMVRQARYFVPALALCALCALVPLEKVRGKMSVITLVTLAGLFLPFIPGLGENRNGATRWIDLGITTFQPSEIWKPVSVLYLAHILDRKKDNPTPGSLIPPFLLTGFACLVIFLQNDLSTALIAGIAACVLFWVGGAPLSFFGGLCAVAVPLGALSVLTSDFRLKRILAFLYPAYEPHGQSYQILGSIRAISAGGFFGKGIGLGTLKLGSVPEVQSDFIFAAWTEETGLVGVLAFFALWGLFAWRCLRRAFAEKDSFRSWLGFGLVTLLLSEVIINTAMASGVIPATGIPLPLFSAGGTSLLSTAGTMGLLINLARNGGTEGGANV